MNKLIFDIETIPNDRSDLDEYFKLEPPKNYKDPEKIQKWIDEHQGDIIKQRSLSPEGGRIICIEMIFNDEFIIHSNYTETFLISDFWKYFEKCNTLIGFNSISFDLPFIIKRSIYYKIPIPDTIYQYLRKYSYYPHFDVLMFFSDWQPKKNHNLEYYCKAYGIEYKSEIGGDEVYEYYQKGEYDKIKQHCLEDVRATNELYKLCPLPLDLFGG